MDSCAIENQNDLLDRIQSGRDRIIIEAILKNPELYQSEIVHILKFAGIYTNSSDIFRIMNSGKIPKELVKIVRTINRKKSNSSYYRRKIHFQYDYFQLCNISFHLPRDENGIPMNCAYSVKSGLLLSPIPKKEAEPKKEVVPKKRSYTAWTPRKSNSKEQTSRLTELAIAIAYDFVLAPSDVTCVVFADELGYCRARVSQLLHNPVLASEPGLTRAIQKRLDGNRRYRAYQQKE